MYSLASFQMKTYTHYKLEKKTGFFRSEPTLPDQGAQKSVETPFWKEFTLDRECICVSTHLIKRAFVKADTDVETEESAS